MTQDKLSIKLSDSILYSDSKPYIIAEIGVNHEGSINLATKLIDLAKEGGASAAKFQSYKANTLASRQSPSYWDTTKEPTRSQHELFQKYDHFEPEDYVALGEYCRIKDIDFIGVNASQILSKFSFCFIFSKMENSTKPFDI